MFLNLFFYHVLFYFIIFLWNQFRFLLPYSDFGKCSGPMVHFRNRSQSRQHEEIHQFLAVFGDFTPVYILKWTWNWSHDGNRRWATRMFPPIHQSRLKFGVRIPGTWEECQSPWNLKVICCHGVTACQNHFLCLLKLFISAIALIFLFNAVLFLNHFSNHFLKMKTAVHSFESYVITCHGVESVDKYSCHV